MRNPWSQCLKLLIASLLLTELAIAGTTTIELSAEASRQVPNDLAHATMFAEATGAAPVEAAKRVNALISGALATAKENPKVKVQTTGTSTYPINNKGGGRIESWRMRSEMMLESRDITVLSELIGKLQANLGVAGVTLMPTPETRRKAEDEAALDAIAAFRARAKLIAEFFGKSYKIKNINVGTHGIRSPLQGMRGVPMAAAMEASPLPMEAGESVVSVTVTGKIEIPD